MEFPRIALKVSPSAFRKLVDLGSRVESSMTGNLIYSTPTPSLTVLATAVTNTAAAIAVFGQKGSRGSHADYVDLCNKAQNLHLILKAMAQYVANTCEQQAGTDYALMKNLMTTSGFTLAQAKSTQGSLEAPLNFRIFITRSIALNQVKLKWARPLNTLSTADVNNYVVRRNTTTDFNSSVAIASATKGEFIDSNTSGAAVTYYYWVVGYNSAGAGVPSSMLTATLPVAI